MDVLFPDQAGEEDSSTRPGMTAHSEKADNSHHHSVKAENTVRQQHPLGQRSRLYSQRKLLDVINEMGNSDPKEGELFQKYPLSDWRRKICFLLTHSSLFHCPSRGKRDDNHTLVLFSARSEYLLADAASRAEPPNQTDS